MWPSKQVYGFIPRMKIHDKLKIIPTNRPISIETMTTVKNVTIQTVASKRDIFQNVKNCLICISIPLSATTTTLAKTHCKNKNKNNSKKSNKIENNGFFKTNAYTW